MKTVRTMGHLVTQFWVLNHSQFSYAHSQSSSFHSQFSYITHNENFPLTFVLPHTQLSYTH